mmetsp:Transcript_14075/g.47651  ORF Transcript_14075/g.47651 Transcript_14075/m.47651 type:complete len:177 (+) Transcript_14075:63-593(+)
MATVRPLPEGSSPRDPRKEARRRSEREDGPWDILLAKYGAAAHREAAAVDGLTAVDIRELRSLMAAAAAREDYGRASRLKGGVTALVGLGAEILRLDNERIAAVACDDFESAKLLAGEIRELRATAAARRGEALSEADDPPAQASARRVVSTSEGSRAGDGLAPAGEDAPAKDTPR